MGIKYSHRKGIYYKDKETLVIGKYIDYIGSRIIYVTNTIKKIILESEDFCLEEDTFVFEPNSKIETIVISGKEYPIFVSNSDNKYVYTVLTLNTFFHRKGITGAVDFINTTNTSKYGRVSNNLKEKIGNWIASAKEKKDIINASKDTSAVPKPESTNTFNIVIKTVTRAIVP